MRRFDCSRRGLLLAATSVIGMSIAAPAAAQATGEPVADYDIVTNDDVTPGTGSTATGANYANSPDVLDTGVTGIGQMITIDQVNTTDAFLGLCTGTLINPRTVITAAHCVFDRPADQYGAQTGSGGGLYGQVGASLTPTKGVPISFGFSSTNRCIGTNGCTSGTGAYEAWRDSGFHTNVALNIYNGNQVWYHPSSGEFGLGDIALVTLDTHAQDIPTWALLFSPLDGPTHASIVGYGSAGVGTSGIGAAAGIDYRRRAAENMIDALMSSNDWATTPAISGPDYTGLAAHQHSLYWFDFDDPDWSVGRANSDPNFFNNTAAEGEADNGYYDFNGLGDGALPREGGTAGGDSGGPLIVDERWDIDVLAGVLTGGWSFGGDSYYGDFSVYPPLFLYWQSIVQNNPYKYVSAKAGNGDWFDPSHWVQDMDPNYMVIGAAGQLVNSLPGAQLGQDNPAGRFGEVCFLNQSCGTITGTPYSGGTYAPIAGGPGSSNFVPNNVEPVNSANPRKNVQARYYDVTLSQAGTTSLNKAATIDRFTISNSAAKLDIRSKGSLNVLADYTQAAGHTNVDGKLTTGEAVVVSGLVTGKGTWDPTYLTVVGGLVAPGGSGIGTLTVQGDMIMASASTLLLDVGSNGRLDQLKVVGDASNSGILDVTGASLVLNNVAGASGPRHGQSFELASAAGGVIGAFTGASTFQGVLVPTLSQAAGNITVSLQAGSFASYLDGAKGATLAFAEALDGLRAGSYSNLETLYGAVDWMNPDQLSATFASLTPRVVGDVGALQDRQSRLLLTSVGDRLSLLASGKAKGLTMAGDLTAAFQARNDGLQSGRLGFGASNGGAVALGKLPGRMTGFVAGGVDRSTSSYGGNQLYGSQGGWHMAMGLEMPLGEDGAFGTAAGFAEGESSPSGDHNRSRTTMAAAYASMPLGEGFYVGGLVSAETSRASTDRSTTDGSQVLRLSGATHATRYSALAEVGFERGIGRGLTLTPRAQLGYSHYSLGGFTEEGGETALALDDVTVSRVEARFGAKLEGKTRFAGVTIVPQLTADYVSLLSGRKTGATVRFAAAPDEAFHLPLAESAAGWAEVRGGVTFGDGPLTLGLSGQHATGGAMVDQRAQADLRFRF